MDATEFGIQFFFLIILPGFASAVGFKLTAGIKGKGADFAALCYAAFFGAILFSIWKSGLGDNIDKLPEYIAAPFTTGPTLAVGGFIIGFILGLPVGWIRSKLR